MATPPSRSDHRTNHHLAALEPDDFAAPEPHLESVTLPKGTIVYETGDRLTYAYFPHDTVVALITVLPDGKTVEMAVFGLGSALVTGRSLGPWDLGFGLDLAVRAGRGED